jgi:hypothetical protein
VLWYVFQLTKKVTGGWGNLDNEEIHYLYPVPKIIIIKLRIVKWAEHVAFMGEKRKV